MLLLLTCVIGSTSLDDSSIHNPQVMLCPTTLTQGCLFRSQFEMKNYTKTAGKDERKTLTGGVPLPFQVTPRTAPAVYILTRLAWRLRTRWSRKAASCLSGTLVGQSLVIGLSSLQSNTICSMPRVVRCLQI
ncbi:hypothetical protein EDD22DRAFT_58550 [Suillus occidentalis]|nr:hypothetical protein EDD22DRAFT_58550 [Suillus occidentalis]